MVLERQAEKPEPCHVISSGARNLYMTTLTATEIALARHHTYALLGRLYADGLTAELLPYARELLGESPYALPNTQFDADEAAATHYTLFHLNIFPYQAIFRDSSGLLGGAESERVRAVYQESGFETAEPDHIASELNFLAFLCAAEAEARQDGLDKVAAQCQARQQTFLGSHLLTWLPAFVIALQQAGQPFYTALATLTLDFAADHATTVGATLVVAPDAVAHDAVGHDRPSGQAQGLPLQDAKTGLKDIARYLIMPPHSGLYLSREAIGNLARAHNLPRGFGSRQQVLSNLLYTAVQYDSLSEVLAGLQTILGSWQLGYAKIKGLAPHLTPFLTPWQERLAQTAVLLQQVQAAVNETGP
jgi:putative dimethyl sulfoxide reductase chaperone